jgi:hypothetical protein
MRPQDIDVGRVYETVGTGVMWEVVSAAGSILLVVRTDKKLAPMRIDEQAFARMVFRAVEPVSEAEGVNG